MKNKRHLDDPEPCNNKRTQTTTTPSVLGYFKKHYTYQTFNSKDLLLLLNCETPETVKEEARRQLDNILDVKNLKKEVKKFVSCLLLDNLKCLNDPNAEQYWEEKRSRAAMMTSSHKQLQLYHGVSSAMLDNALLDVQRVIPENTPSPASLAETEPFKESIWSIWSKVLYNMVTENYEDQDINKYSLEYLGIIILGHHIGNKQSRNFYPKDLVLKTNELIEIPVFNVFQKFLSFYPPLFEALAVSLDECHTVLLKNCLKVKKTADPGLQFTFDFFMIFVTQILNKPDVLFEQESIYNYRAIFRFLDTVVSAAPSYTFFPAETRLHAISKELERLNMSTKSYYNADGIIFDNATKLELCLLETSGPFGLVNASRETTDHVKAAYGLLAMLHTIAYRFIYADIEVFKKLQICFVHAAQDRIRIWSFRLIDKELYVLNRVDSAVLPISHSDKFEDQFTNLVNLFWKLKMLLDDSKSILDELEVSHNKNKTASHFPRLDEYLVETAEVKLSSRISEVSDIFISSSPIRPDSQ